jgi:hypothetical protein
MQDYLWNKHMAAVKWLCTVVVLQHHFILQQLDSADHQMLHGNPGLYCSSQKTGEKGKELENPSPSHTQTQH